MKNQSKILSLLCCVIFSAFAFGCRMEDDSVPAVQRPSTKADPCAERLHDLCGQLLLYHGMHKRLPKSLDELAAIEGRDIAPPACPVSGLAYVYKPTGLRVPGSPGLIVAYDATACHSGMRWCIRVDEAGSGKTLTARVVLLSEEALRSAMKKP